MDKIDRELLNRIIEQNNEHNKAIEKIDIQLMDIQRSTRTLFKLFQPLHEKARENWKWYYRWHVRPSTIKVHWTVFGLCNIVAIISILTFALTPTNLTQATAETPIVSSNTGITVDSISDGSITADKLVGNDIATVGTVISGVWDGTDIGWIKVNKTKSSLADLATRSAGDLNSGTLSDSLLSENITNLGNTFNNAGQLLQLDASGYLPAINGEALTNLTQSQVGLPNVENTALSTWTGSTNITNLGTINTGAWNGSVIAWGKIDKAGSSLADLTTRSAGDLNSGTLSDSRLSSNITKQGDTFNGAGQLLQLDASGYLPAINGEALTNLTQSQVGLPNVENTALSTWTGSTNITNLGTINTGAWNGSVISWGKIDKAGSSLADLTTRSAGDLNSGTLSDLRLSANVTLLGNLTSGTGSIVRSISPTLTGNLGINAHINSTQTTAPTISAPLRCGTAGYSASVTAGSSDSAGSFTINAGTGTPRDTCNTTITFYTAYATAPKAVILSPGYCSNAANCSAHKEINVSAVTTTSFTIKMNNSPTASEVNTWYYWVIE